MMLLSGKRKILQYVLYYAVMLSLAVPYLLPLFWMLATSLKAEHELYASHGEQLLSVSWDNFFSSDPQWTNYLRAIHSVPFVTYLKNTLFLCIMNVVSAVFSSAMVAYGFARLKFWGRGALFILMISTMVLPPQVTMIPVFAIFKKLGWYGSFLPLIVPLFCGVPFFIFLLSQFYRSFPEELFESARIDGAREWSIFLRILLPLSKPALATCALFQFLGSWNDFFGPLLYINDPSKYTLAYGLQQFMSSYGGQWAELMAASTMFTLPAIILFFLAQKTFIQGIVTTGLKG